MKITAWGNIEIESSNYGYKVSGIYEGVDFYGEFWEDEDGDQNNLSFSGTVEDKFQAISDVKEELNKFKFGG